MFLAMLALATVVCDQGVVIVLFCFVLIIKSILMVSKKANLDIPLPAIFLLYTSNFNVHIMICTVIDLK